MTSDAVQAGAISKVVGYKITKGQFQEVQDNLPRKILVIGEATAAVNTAGLDTTLQQVTSEQEAGDLYGYGSPIHMAVRNLLPNSGSGVGSIPVYCGAQDEAGGAVAKIDQITVTGTATGSGTAILRINGRTSIEGESYEFAIAEGDTATDVAASIVSAISGVLRAPCTATNTLGVVDVTAKWKGISSEALNIEVVTGDDALGMTYAVANSTPGSGQPTVTSTLNLIGDDWITGVVNCYGDVTAVIQELETFNGIPDPTAPTGRYASTTFKPFIAYTGTTADDPSTSTDAAGRKTQVTAAFCVAPNSKNFACEVGAAYARVYETLAQSNPEQDPTGQALPDITTTASLGTMDSYTNRDLIVKKGCSTVILVDGQFIIQDFVTTYHPTGENPPQFRYVRDLAGVDWNVRYSYYLLEQIEVVGKVIADDDDAVSVNNLIKPKMWKGSLVDLGTQLGLRGLIADVEFMQDSIEVALSTTNPNRLETFFRYKRSGVARVSSTTAEAGFNFGSLTAN